MWRRSNDEAEIVVHAVDKTANSNDGRADAKWSECKVRVQSGVMKQVMGKKNEDMAKKMKVQNEEVISKIQ